MVAVCNNEVLLLPWHQVYYRRIDLQPMIVRREPHLSSLTSDVLETHLPNLVYPNLGVPEIEHGFELQLRLRLECVDGHLLNEAVLAFDDHSVVEVFNQVCLEVHK